MKIVYVVTKDAALEKWIQELPKRPFFNDVKFEIAEYFSLSDYPRDSVNVLIIDGKIERAYDILFEVRSNDEWKSIPMMGLRVDREKEAKALNQAGLYTDKFDVLLSYPVEPTEFLSFTQRILWSADNEQDLQFIL